MKANEIQIGDWVMVNDIEHTHPLQVAEIFNKCGAYYATLYWDGMPDNVNPKTLTADVDKVLPIPLTPEILEKNGFEKCEGNEFSFYKKEEERALYQVLWSAKELYLEIAPYTSKTGEFNRMGVEFVHQLQQALRLCGIEKEIEL